MLLFHGRVRCLDLHNHVAASDPAEADLSAPGSQAPAGAAGTPQKSSATSVTPAKPPSGAKKPLGQSGKAKKAPQPITAVDARNKAVYQAMEVLLDQGAFSDADLLRLVSNLSEDEFLQVD